MDSSIPKTTDETPAEYLIRRWEIISKFEKEVWEKGTVSPRSLVYFIKQASAGEREHQILKKHRDLVELIKGLDPTDPYWMD